MKRLYGRGRRRRDIEWKSEEASKEEERWILFGCPDRDRGRRKKRQLSCLILLQRTKA